MTQMMRVIETFEERVMKKLDELNTRLGEQAFSMETLHTKVDLSMELLGQVQTGSSSASEGGRNTTTTTTAAVTEATPTSTSDDPVA